MATITKRTSSSGEVTFRIKVSLGYDSENRQIIKSMTYRPDKGMTKRQAEKEADRQAVLFEMECREQAEAEEEKGVKPVKFSELAEEYLVMLEETQSQKPSSINRLKSLREKTYEQIGDIRVDQITHKMVQGFIRYISMQSNQRNGKRLSVKTQKHYLTFVGSVMRYAIDCEMISQSPCHDIRTYKSQTDEKKEKDIYSLDEVKHLLKALDQSASLHYKAFFFLMAYLGLRRGEVLGLEFKDFDFEHHTVFIRRTSNYQNHTTGVYTGTPKTQRSRRLLSVNDEILSLVRQLKAEQEEMRFNCGDQWHDTDRLFVSWNGVPIYPNTPYTWLERFCRNNDIPFNGLHALRHTFATQAITNSIDVSTVSSMLGHSQTSTTLNIYTHKNDAVSAEASRVITGLYDF